MSKERICDVCGEVIRKTTNSGPGVIKPNLVLKIYQGFREFSSYQKQDLCGECTSNLKDALEDMKNNENS